MNADDLKKRIVAYGADLSGINDRFMGNAELYASCLDELLDESGFLQLRQAVCARDYQNAFSSAHALKGLSGNLGLIPIYDAASRLVESLRAKEYGDLDAEFAAVEHAYLRLKAVLDENASLPDSAAAEQPDLRAEAEAKQGAGLRRRKNIDPLISALAYTLAAVFICFGLLFARLYSNCRNNPIQEGDADICRLVERLPDIRGVTDIQLYTENGFAVSRTYSIGICALRRAFETSSSDLRYITKRLESGGDAREARMTAKNGAGRCDRAGRRRPCQACPVRTMIRPLILPVSVKRNGKGSRL